MNPELLFPWVWSTEHATPAVRVPSHAFQYGALHYSSAYIDCLCYAHQSEYVCQ